MEMIAMLDGLGMNADGTYPIGDVNPATSPRDYKPPRPASLPPTPPAGITAPAPMTSYPLGAASDQTPEPPADAPGSTESSGFLGISGPGWLGILAIAVIAIPLVQRFFAPKVSAEPQGPVNGFGYGEPEMVEFPKKKRRRRRRK